MIRPSVVNNEATAMIRWNDVIGRPSQAPNRLRGLSFSGFPGSLSAAALAGDVVSAAGSASPLSAGSPCGTSLALLPRRNSRVSAIPARLPDRRAHGGGECIAAVGVTGELVKRRTGRCQEHRVTGFGQA